MNNSPQIKNPNYVLITAAHNEEAYIDYTIKSVLSQTILPQKWIIVSDGSTDGTNDIVIQYASQNDFIELICREVKHEKVDFSSKVLAIHEGYEKIKKMEYDFIGILDGDISFSPSFYENVLARFNENHKLGIAGGIVFDISGDRYIRRSPIYSEYVLGCMQLFRRKCYEDIGGLLPIKEGGEDTIAVFTARMKGWEVVAFEELTILHHKYSKAIRGKLREGFREGKMFYSIGSHPVFEIMKSIRRLNEKPYFFYAFTRILGYIWQYFRKKNRDVSDEFIRYLRKEQLSRIRFEVLKKNPFCNRYQCFIIFFFIITYIKH
jgi:glycosyltransferase involved in cell wall biosynthesis